MSLPRFSVNNSLFVNLVSVIIIIIGLIVVFGMNREIFPNVSFDMVSVTTVFPGATPEDVEKLITVPIEKELKEVDGLKEVNSTSAASTSLIYVKLDPDEPDKQKVIRDIQSAVDKVKDLPADIQDDPEVVEVTSKQYPIVEVSLSGKMSERKLQEYADALEDEIEDIKGVARIQKSGYRDREVQVRVNPDKLEEYYVSMDEIETALAGRNVSLPAGKIDTATTEYSVRTTGEFQTAEEVENVIIRANDSGNWLKIKDVAEVVDTFKDEDIVNKTKATRSINLVVSKKESGDAISIVDNIKTISDKFLERIKGELEISYVNDYSFFARRRLNVLKNNAWFGVIIVIVIMLVFLQKRVALFTVLGIPISFFATFIVMDMMGITINMISMFGLVVVLGMLVDDGIIVAENVYRYMEEGLSPQEAAIKGTEEVMGAVCAAVFTTIAAFSPLLFMTGIIGKFIWNIPAVVITALLASLGEALIILPSHMADFVKIRTDKKGKPMLKRELPWFKKIVSFYTKTVNLAIRHKYRVLIGFIAALFFSFFLATHVMKFILFPSAGINFFFIRAEAPIGTPLEKTEEMMKPLEKLVAELPEEELDAYVTAIGKIEEDRQDPFAGQASNLAQITVYLTPEQDRKRKVEQIIKDLRKKAGNIKGFDDLRFDMPEAGPPVGKPVEARVRGENFETLDAISTEYMDYIKTIDGATDINWDHKPGKEEIRVKVDREKATMAGLSVQQIARTIRGVFQGNIATKIKPVKAEEETDVTVMFDKENGSFDMNVFDEVLVVNKYGNLIPLNKVATIEKVPGSTTIKHLDGKRVVTTSCNVDTTKVTSLEVNKKLMKKFQDISERHIGYSVKYGGEQEESVESLISLAKAFFFAFLVVYLILASFFKSLIQPMIVMLAIPFGLIGVIVAFLLHGQPFSFLAILGVVGLNGIVVNDSIVLVDFINKLRRSGTNRHDSIIRAGQMRLRPVILTTVTTAGGLSTVAYGIGGKDPFLVPMAMSLCWGLVFATVLTLVIIPCIYSILDDLTIKVAHHTSMIEPRKLEEESGS